MPIHTKLGVSVEPSIEDLLTIEELAVRLKVPKSWIYTHTRGRSKCHLPYIKLGKYLRFEEGAVRLARNPADRVWKFSARNALMNSTIPVGTELSGRVIGKDTKKMMRSRYQTGSLFVRGKRKKMYVARYYEEVIDSEGQSRKVRRSVILGSVAEVGNRKDAHNRLLEVLQPINLGHEKPKTILTFNEFVEEHWQVGVLPLFKLSTQIGYGPLLRRYLLPQFGSKPLAEITSPHVQEFSGQLSKTGASWYTVRNLRNLLSRIVRNAVEWGYIHRNPVTGVKLPPRPLPSKRQFLSPPEVRGLIAQLKEPYRSMVLFDVLTGLSRGELFALRWSVVDFEGSLLEVREAVYEGNFGTPKTRNRNRRVPLSRAALDVLKFHRIRSIRTGPTDLVFASRHGTPIRPDNVRKRVIHPACDGLKIPRVGWHVLHHTHATMLSELGEPVKVAQAILGHADIETTLSVYTHSVPDSERRAEEKLANLVLDPNGPKLRKSQKPGPRQPIWIN